MDPDLSTQLIALGAAIWVLLCAALRYAITDTNAGAFSERSGGGDRIAKEASRVLDAEEEIVARFSGAELLGAAIFCLSTSELVGALWPLPRWGLGLLLAGGLVLLETFGCALGIVLSNRSAGVVLGALRLARPIEWLASPLTWPITRLLSREPSRPEPASAEVKHLIDVGEAEGNFRQHQAKLLRSVLEFETTVAREVMVPRPKMITLEVEMTLGEALQIIYESGHSRYPVYRETPDEMVGVLYAKDAYAAMQREPEAHREAIAKWMRGPVLFAPENQNVGVLLRRMQRQHFHLAILSDEFGGVAGLVSLEDILEEIVGEIEDEHDDDVLIEVVAPGHLIADATVSIYDLAERLGEPPLVIEGELDPLLNSIGGLVMELAGRVPAPGECVQRGAYELKVLASDERHVTRVEIQRRALSAADPADAQP